MCAARAPRGRSMQRRQAARAWSRKQTPLDPNLPPPRRHTAPHPTPPRCWCCCSGAAPASRPRVGVGSAKPPTRQPSTSTPTPTTPTPTPAGRGLQHLPGGLLDARLPGAAARPGRRRQPAARGGPAGGAGRVSGPVQKGGGGRRVWVLRGLHTGFRGFGACTGFRAWAGLRVWGFGGPPRGPAGPVGSGVRATG